MFTKGPWYAEMPPRRQIRTLAKCKDREPYDDMVAIVGQGARTEDIVLMAAAPDMFEALEAALAVGYSLPLEKMRAALAKAKGE